jgi:hypothetical protein
MADPILNALDLPFTEAIAFFRQKLRVPTERWDDLWQTAHTHGFMVAGAASDDLLADFQTELRKALEQGTTQAEFRAAFDTIVEKHGWAYNGTPGWRSEIIYQTNMAMAFAAGRYAQQTDPAVVEHFPYFTYRHSGSSHPRLQHLAWDGITLPWNDPFWDTHYAPNGWRCGCRILSTSREGLARMGKSGPDKAPKVVTVPWRDSRGTIHMVPEGISPGFAYNPGRAWIEGPQAMPVSGPGWKPVGDTPR